MGQQASSNSQGPTTSLAVGLGGVSVAVPGGLVLPRDVVYCILKQSVLTLTDHYAVMRVCRLWYHISNAPELWNLRLHAFAEAEFPGRTAWTGYQAVPVFFSDEWRPYREQMARTVSGLFSSVDRDAIELRGQWKQRFHIKRVMRTRFEDFSGWGSLLHHHFIEGYFSSGSLLLGNLYDIATGRIVYSGFLQRGRRESPLGLSYHPNGAVAYRGPWADDQPHGRGKTFWKNGKLQYEGQFERGAKHGIGKQYWAAGSYEGEWQRDEPNGNGTIIIGAKTYVGCVKGGKRSGFGIQLHPNGTTEYQGMWEMDLPNGFSKHYTSDGLLDYEGEWRDGLQHGQGCQWRAGNVVVYKGAYAHGLRQGVGALYHDDGVHVRYHGEWLQDQQHGKGVLYRADGSVEWSGRWRRGHPESANEDSLLDDASVADESTALDASGFDTTLDHSLDVSGVFSPFTPKSAAKPQRHF